MSGPDADRAKLTVFVVIQNNHPQMVFATRKAAETECNVRNVPLRSLTGLNSHWSVSEFAVKGDHLKATQLPPTGTNESEGK